MKIKNLILSACLCAGLVFSGCSSMSTTQKSTTKGAAIGAGAGAVVGAGTGLAVAAIAGKNKKKAVIIGAAAGTAVGATAGAIIGNKIGKKKQALEEQALAAELVKDQNGNDAIKLNLPEESMQFATGKSAVGAAGKQALAEAAKKLVAGEATGEIYNVQVVGHTDKTGSLEANQKVSKARANAVADILKANGINAARIVADGVDYQMYDESKSAKENRRVEVYISASQEMINAAENGTLK